MRDIKLSEQYDLIFRRGDIVDDLADKQHQELLLLYNKGDLKEFTLAGVGLFAFINDEVWYGEVSSEIKRVFEADGMEVNDIEFEDYENVTIDANYPG